MPQFQTYWRALGWDHDEGFAREDDFTSLVDADGLQTDPAFFLKKLQHSQAEGNLVANEDWLEEFQSLGKVNRAQAWETST